MLRQGPVDKNDVKPNHVKPENLQGDLRHWHEAMSTTKNLKNKITSRSQGEFPPKQDIAWYLYWKFSLYSLTNVRTPSPVQLFILFPFHFNDSFWKDPLARHLSNSTKVSQVSNTTGTPLVQRLIPFYSTVSRPPQTPCAKHQALAPFLPM